MFSLKSATRTVFRGVMLPTVRHKGSATRSLSSAVKPFQNSKGRAVTTILSLAAALVAYQSLSAPEVHAEALPSKLQQNQLYSQHVQIIESWKNPGVYAWGSNKGGVVAPDSSEDYIRAPRRLAFFDNILIRDLKLGNDVGLAVDERGNLYEWGTGYSKGIRKPEVILAGKDIKAVQASADRVFALSRDGTIYSIPKSKIGQQEGPKPDEASSIPFMTRKSPICYRKINVPLGYFESVMDIAAGVDHLLILTSNGHVFASAASGHYPDKGQLGNPGLTWETRPKDRPYDTPFQVPIPGRPKVTQISAGDYHSVLLDSDGKVWAFGENAYGQLGFGYNPETPVVDVPTELTLQSLYAEKNTTTKCTNISAGGLNSYFMVDAVEGANGSTSADVWASGNGLWGALGNGKWTHAQGKPTKIKKLSGLREYDEVANKIMPIRVAYICPGRTHVAAVMATRTNTNATSSNKVFNGQDVLWWGNNEFFQLGTRKRNNLNVPTYIPPLEGADAEATVAEEQQVVPQSRLQITPRQRVVLGNGRKAEIEQRVVVGPGVSGVYSKV